MTTALWILLALAAGVVTFCYAMLKRRNDEADARMGSTVSEKPLHIDGAWGRFSDARKQYEASARGWMTDEEIAAREDL